MSKKKDTVSVLVRPTRALMTRLDALARLHQRESANQVMVEIAAMYSEYWNEVQNAKDGMLRQQWEHTKKLLTKPLHPAEADGESLTKTQAQGKKGRK
jgi:hypothetical protein